MPLLLLLLLQPLHHLAPGPALALAQGNHQQQQQRQRRLWQQHKQLRHANM
jgi:hypothetical protein